MQNNKESLLLLKLKRSEEIKLQDNCENDEVAYNSFINHEIESPNKDSKHLSAPNYSFEMCDDSLNVHTQTPQSKGMIIIIILIGYHGSGTFDISLMKDYQTIVKRYENLKRRTESKFATTKESDTLFDYKAKSRDNLNDYKNKGKNWF